MSEKIEDMVDDAEWANTFRALTRIFSVAVPGPSPQVIPIVRADEQVFLPCNCSGCMGKHGYTQCMAGSNPSTTVM